MEEPRADSGPPGSRRPERAGFRYGIRIQPSGRVVLSVFEGPMTLADERETMEALVRTPGVDLTADLLVDRRRATSEVDPEDFSTRLAEARAAFPEPEGARPRLALVVSTDLEYGMARMFELASAGQTPHEVRVFRELEAACDWLEVEADALVWPRGMTPRWPSSELP